MSQLEEALREHEERCERRLSTRYVHWAWMVGILIVITMSIGGSTWAISSEFNSVKNTANSAKEETVKLEERINRLEDMYKDIKVIRSLLENNNAITKR